MYLLMCNACLLYIVYLHQSVLYVRATDGHCHKRKGMLVCMQTGHVSPAMHTTGTSACAH